MADAAGWVRVERREGGYAVLSLQREPVNTMSLELWRRLAGALDELEADPQARAAAAAVPAPLCACLGQHAFFTSASGQGSRASDPAAYLGARPLAWCMQVRGVIFCSGLARDVFTAGNDINELYAPLTSRERYRCAVWRLGPCSQSGCLSCHVAGPRVFVSAAGGPRPVCLPPSPELPGSFG